jgi:hypothetical protein
MMMAESLARELGARRSGSGWMARCPAHAPDNNPSLSISERGGKLLVHCFAGCDQQDVIDALRARGLWALAPHEKSTTEARIQWRRDCERREAAEWWARSAEALARLTLENLDSADPERAAITRLLFTIRSGLTSTLAAYDEWRAKEPTLTAAMVSAGRTSDARRQRALAMFIVGG